MGSFSTEEENKVCYITRAMLTFYKVINPYAKTCPLLQSTVNPRLLISQACHLAMLPTILSLLFGIKKKHKPCLHECGV